MNDKLNNPPAPQVIKVKQKAEIQNFYINDEKDCSGVMQIDIKLSDNARTPYTYATILNKLDELLKEL